MNTLFRTGVLAASITITGCAATPAPPLSPDHPASPKASAAPAPARSTTLALEPADRSAGTGAAHGRAEPAAAAAYTCRHHPEVTQATPGTCPKCKMKLVPGEPGDATPAAPDHSDHADHAGAAHHGGHNK